MLYKISVAVFLFAVILTPFVHASDELLISTSNVMPWGIEKAEGKHEGLLVSFADRLEKKLGQPLINKMRPYPRVLKDIELGKCDLAVLYKGALSDKIGTSLGTIVKADIIAVSLANHKPIQNLADLNGERVAHVRGAVYGPSFDKNEDIIKVPVKDMNQGLKMLIKGHVSAVVSADQSIFYGIDTLGIDPRKLKRVLTIGTAIADLYLSHKSSNQGSADDIRRALSEMINDGVLNEIFYSRDYISGGFLNKDNHSKYLNTYSSEALIADR